MGWIARMGTLRGRYGTRIPSLLRLRSPSSQPAARFSLHHSLRPLVLAPGEMGVQQLLPQNPKNMDFGGGR